MNVLPDGFVAMDDSVALYGLLGTIALGFLSVLGLFISLKQELTRAVRRERRRVDQLLHQVQEAAHMDSVNLLNSHASGTAPITPAANSTARDTADYLSSRSYSARVVALRNHPTQSVPWRTAAIELWRQGHPSNEIAAALGSRQAEVELLLRVQQTLERSSQLEEPSPSGPESAAPLNVPEDRNLSAGYPAPAKVRRKAAGD